MQIMCPAKHWIHLWNICIFLCFNLCFFQLKLVVDVWYCSVSEREILLLLPIIHTNGAFHVMYNITTTQILPFEQNIWINLGAVMVKNIWMSTCITIFITHYKFQLNLLTAQFTLGGPMQCTNSTITWSKIDVY